MLGDGLGEVLGLLVLGDGLGVLLAVGLFGLLLVLDGVGLLFTVGAGELDVELVLGDGDGVLEPVLLLDGDGLPDFVADRDGVADLDLVAGVVGLADLVMVVMPVLSGVAPDATLGWRRLCPATLWRLAPAATAAVSLAALGRTEQSTFSIGGLPPDWWPSVDTLASATPTRPRFTSTTPTASALSASVLRTCILTWPASRSKFPPRVCRHPP